MITQRFANSSNHCSSITNFGAPFNDNQLLRMTHPVLVSENGKITLFGRQTTSASQVLAKQIISVTIDLRIIQ
jgi:hypothetical protein